MNYVLITALVGCIAIIGLVTGRLLYIQGQAPKWPDLWLRKTFELRERAHRLENENDMLRANAKHDAAELAKLRGLVQHYGAEIASLEIALNTFKENSK